jgi:precorrin-4/cobalt-precorrin-4 C11-methyltransferase
MFFKLVLKLYYWEGIMVYFIDAGPGDIELITIKAVKRIEMSDIIIYAGAMINKDIINYAKKNCVVYNSTKMSFQQIIKVLKEASDRNKKVSSIFTEDPCFNKTITNQINILKKLGIDFEIIPGVSTYMMSASVMKKEYGILETPHTVIIKKIFDEKFDFNSINLKDTFDSNSIIMILFNCNYKNFVVKELKSKFKRKTKIMIAYNISWREQKLIKGNLEDINSKIEDINIKGNIIIALGSLLEDDEERMNFSENILSDFIKDNKFNNIENLIK